MLTVKEVSKISGVSIRAIQYYDKIGLLKPAQRNASLYRLYGENELLLLQQILFYKELGFSLREIEQCIYDPQFNVIEALQKHKRTIKKQQLRLNHLLQTIDHTIHQLKTDTVMSKPEILYRGLPKEFATSYREEAINEYGKDVIETAEKGLLDMGEDAFTALKKAFGALNEELFEICTEAPDSNKVQQLIAEHYRMIRQFWGTSGQADLQSEAYAALGDLYVADDRFTRVHGNPQPKFAQFLRDAMKHFANKLGN